MLHFPVQLNRLMVTTCVAGQHLPFIQYVATLAIVQAVRELAQQRLKVTGPFVRCKTSWAQHSTHHTTVTDVIMKCRGVLSTSESSGQMIFTSMT